MIHTYKNKHVTQKEELFPATGKKTYNTITWTSYCRGCGKVVSLSPLLPTKMRAFIKGVIASDELMEGVEVEDDVAFQLLFHICPTCNAGYEIEDIKIKPSAEDKQDD